MNKYEMIYILDTACTDEKREALMADKTVKKAADFIDEKPAGTASEEYAHVMRACGEVDGRPNCNRDCDHCMRKHCPYRKK